MKIGRNDACPCGSGKKFKRCCSGSGGGMVPRKSGKQKQPTLGGVIQQFQKLALEKKKMVHQVGVFLLYSDRNGDAWVLEVTDSDCVQIASSGTPLDVPLEENEETITVEWTHTFSFTGKKMEITSYSHKKKEIVKNAPVQQLTAARRNIWKQLSPEVRDQVHIDA